MCVRHLEGTQRGGLPFGPREKPFSLFQMIFTSAVGEKEDRASWSGPSSLFLRFVVHGLTTGEQYVFRVKAVNPVGTSENSQESDIIKVQAALSK